MRLTEHIDELGDHPERPHHDQGKERGKKPPGQWKEEDHQLPARPVPGEERQKGQYDGCAPFLTRVEGRVIQLPKVRLVLVQSVLKRSPGKRSPRKG